MNRRLWMAGAAAGVILAGVGTLAGAKAAEHMDYVERPDMVVIAHRAGAAYAPENTLSALEHAILSRADMAEIDIQQLGDGTLIVMHDYNFYRTTGMSRDVWDACYEEIKDVDAGIAFPGRFTGERIPTLEEMLVCAENRIRLMIEVKISGHEQDLELQLVELLHRYDMDRHCVVGSMERQVLERVKEIDPMLETVYIAHNLKEEDYELDYVDGYSIEGRNMSVAMVERIRAQGKPIYGWTANSRKSMRIIADCGADGIVTDNVPMAQSFIGRSGFYADVAFLWESFVTVRRQ